MGASSETKGPDSNTASSVVLYAESISASFRKKADHNKAESMGSLLVVMTATMIAPLLIAFGDGLFLGKVLPASLSTLAAGVTGWLQLRRPQQLWNIYRDAQRRIEDQTAKYKFKVAEYNSRGDTLEIEADQLLVERVCQIALAAHESWKSIIPGTENLKNALAPAKSTPSGTP